MCVTQMRTLVLGAGGHHGVYAAGFQFDRYGRCSEGSIRLLSWGRIVDETGWDPLHGPSRKTLHAWGLQVMGIFRGGGVMSQDRHFLFGSVTLVVMTTAGLVKALDADGDGVDDAFDVCCHTPNGREVDGEGRPFWDLDDDCDVDLGDHALGHTVFTLQQFARFSRNFTGLLPPDGPCGSTPNNCTAPTAIPGGTTWFSNVGATTDGPNEPIACDFFGYTQVGSDIWFCYTATCNEVVVASLCGSDYDTKMAVYDGCACPSAGPIGCSDDDCGQMGSGSRVVFPVLAGASYMIRVGGYQGRQGDGLITLFCESDPNHGLNACRPGTGNCFVDNGTPGCQDGNTCGLVCAIDPFCCDTEWDDTCAELADGLVNGFDVCGPGNGTCFAANGTPGCEDATCCQGICEQDPFCCLLEWDGLCAGAVPPICGLFAACVNGFGSCFAAHPTSGCNTELCCNAVCTVDPVCCSQGWDALCVNRANDECNRH